MSKKEIPKVTDGGTTQLHQIIPEFSHDTGVIIVFESRKGFKDKFCELLTGSPFQSMSKAKGGAGIGHMKFSEPYYLSEPVDYTELPETQKDRPIKRRLSCVQLLAMTEFGGVNTHPLVSVDLYASLCSLMAVLDMRSQPLLGVLFLGESARIGGAIGPLIEKLARHVIGIGRSQFQFVSFSWIDGNLPPSKAATNEKNEVQIRAWLSRLFSSEDATSKVANRWRFCRISNDAQSAETIVLSFLKHRDALVEASTPILQAAIPDMAELSDMPIGIEIDRKLRKDLKVLEGSIPKGIDAKTTPDKLLADLLDETFQLVAAFLEQHPYSHIDQWKEWSDLRSVVSRLVEARSFVLLFDDTKAFGDKESPNLYSLLQPDTRFPLIAARTRGTYFMVSPSFRGVTDDAILLTHVLRGLAFVCLFGLKFMGVVYCLPKTYDDDRDSGGIIFDFISKLLGSNGLEKLVVIGPSNWSETQMDIVRSRLPGAHCLERDSKPTTQNGSLESRVIACLTGASRGSQVAGSIATGRPAWEEVPHKRFPDTSVGLEIQGFLTRRLIAQEGAFRSSRHRISSTDPKALLPIWERQIRILLLQWSLIRFTGSNRIYEELTREMSESAEVEKNVTRLEAIVALQSNVNPEKGHNVAQLGAMYGAHFNLYGDAQKLDQAIDEYDRAVALIPEDDPKRAEYLSIQAAHLEKKFQLFGSKDDLIRGILRCKEAASWHYQNDTSSTSNLKKAFAQHAVGSMLKRKFEAYFDDPQDIEEALRCFHEARRFTPYGHQAVAIIFADICHSHVLKSKYQSLKNDIPGAVLDIENAIEQYNKTLPDPGPNHPGYAMILNAKCVAYAKHHKLVAVKKHGSKFTPDIHEAIRAGELAVQHVQGQSQECTYLLNLGKAYHYLYDESSQKQSASASEELVLALECFRHAATQCESADKMTRFKAARQWAKLEAEREMAKGQSKPDSKETVKAYEYCIHLLAEVAGQEIPIHEQYRRLERIQAVVYQATGAAIKFGRLDKAAEFFEEGRSVIWRHYFKNDVLLDALKEKDPKLAKEYSQFINQHRSQAADAENSTTYMKRTVPGQPAPPVPSSNFIVEGLRRVKKAITSIAEFSLSFLYKKLNILDKAAENGPIVLVNLYSERCDALIIRKGESVTLVELPLMTAKEAESLQKGMKGVLGGRSGSERGMAPSAKRKVRPAAHDPLVKILERLWITVAHPVVEALKKKSVPKGSHIFWCLSGHLAFLPIHAAGNYESESEDTTLFNWYNSSYIPNIFSLLRKPYESKQSFQILAVAQSRTPNHSPLPKTLEEVEHIKAHEVAKKYAKILVDKEGTTQEVKRELVKSQWAHFACHGIQDEVDGLKSALLLDEGKGLTLKELVELKIPGAELAFLSACQSAKGSITLPEEHIHLAAGMLVAGYQGVIATMWSIQDEDGLFVAKKVYDNLFVAEKEKKGSGFKLFSKGGGEEKGRPNFKEAVGALNKAVAELRKDVEFIRWVPFVHIGL